MLMRRVIVCLDVDGGRVVKGVNFRQLRAVGDPVVLAEHYEAEGADEIVFLDISASDGSRETMWEVVQRTAERLFIPLTVGGGVRSADDVARALRSGADKVSINTAAVDRPELITSSAMRFGAQCVVVSIDAKRRADGGGWEVYTRGGRHATGLDAVSWARQSVRLGAGEILLTSIDRDGARSGYDIELIRSVATAVDVPVVASGGAGTAADVLSALSDGRADAALVAGVLHDRTITVRDVKRLLTACGIPARPGLEQ
jgi:cyclase